MPFGMPSDTVINDGNALENLTIMNNYVLLLVIHIVLRCLLVIYVG